MNALLRFQTEDNVFSLMRARETPADSLISSRQAYWNTSSDESGEKQ